MTALTLGPLVFAGDRLAAIIALVIFLVVTAILSGRIDGRLGNWSLAVVVIGLVAARLGHVAMHWRTFCRPSGSMPCMSRFTPAVLTEYPQLKGAPAFSLCARASERC